MEEIEKFFNKILGKKEPTDNRILFGIALVLFGLLFFGKELHILRSNSFLLSMRMCALYMTVIFLFGRQYKFAVLFAGLTLVAWMPNLIDILGQYSNFILPTIFLVLGGVLIFVAQNQRKKKEEKIEEDKKVEEKVEEPQPEAEKEPVAPLESDYTRYQPQSVQKNDEPEEIHYN